MNNTKVTPQNNNSKNKNPTQNPKPKHISDHFPICFTRKVNSKIPKADHIKTSYRCFKSFNDCAFLVDLRHDLQNFQINRATVDEDFEAFHMLLSIA